MDIKNINTPPPPTPSPMKNEITQQLHERLGRLFSESLNVSSPVAMLHLIREKISVRGYQPFDKDDILQELGQLQRISRQLNSEMLHIYELLKKEG